MTDDRSGAVISPDGRYRYRLWRRWNFELPRLCWIMLNPSTADETINDPTIKRCIAFAQGFGYGGIEVVNLFAWRATQPSELKLASDPVGPDNDAAILNAVGGCDNVLAAWGQHGRIQRRDQAVLELLEQSYTDVGALRVNGDGTPAHPLYLPSHLKPEPFNAWALV